MFYQGMRWWATLAYDVIWVLVFALIGRFSHAEGVTLFGALTTAWPFLVALIGVTIALIGLKRPTESVLNGAILWAGTLLFGMWIRASSGGGVEVSFVIVAGLFLALGMLGWRLVVARLTGSRPTRPAET